MSGFTGTREWMNVHIGARTINAIYKGTTLVWEAVSKIWKHKNIWKHNNTWKH